MKYENGKLVLSEKAQTAYYLHGSERTKLFVFGDNWYLGTSHWIVASRCIVDESNAFYEANDIEELRRALWRVDSVAPNTTGMKPYTLCPESPIPNGWYWKNRYTDGNGNYVSVAEPYALLLDMPETVYVNKGNAVYDAPDFIDVTRLIMTLQPGLEQGEL